MTEDSPVSILIADDNELIRSNLRSVLQSRVGWAVCAEATDGSDALEKAVALKPNVILMDLSMPGLNGIEAAVFISERVPQAKILVVTEHDSRTLAHLPQLPGICGYVVKSRLASDLIPAVESASKQQSLSSPAA